MRIKVSGWLLLTVGVFLIIFVRSVFQHGLFFDGMIYAAISDNLTNGVGSFWYPSFSETIYPVFLEHPPLVFGVEALFMKLFNGAFYAEKIFSCCMAILTAVAIVLIWRQLFEQTNFKKMAWLPVLLWSITPKVGWSYSNNLLENAMAAASLFAFYFFLKAIKKTTFSHLFLAAFFLIIAFLSKGFPGLFPLGVGFLYALFFKQNYAFGRMILQTGVIIGSLLIVGLTIFYVYPQAWQSISAYVNGQVLGSIAGESRVGSRLVLMKNLFNELIPMLIILAGFLMAYRKNIAKIVSANRTHGWMLSLFFVAVGLSAAVPLMISPKLSSFYLIPALPYFCLAFSVFLAPFIEKIAVKIAYHPVFRIIGMLSIVVGITLTVVNSNTYGRDKDTFADIVILEKLLNENQTISLYSTYHQDWTTIAYFQRYLKVNFDRNTANLKLLYLVPKGVEIDNFQCLTKGTQKFDLLKRISQKPQ